MRHDFLRLFLLTYFVCLSVTGISQQVPVTPENGKSIIDSLKNTGLIFHDKQKKPEIYLSREQAIKFLQQRTNTRYWTDPGHPFREALDQLVFEASHEKFDSADYYLRRFPYDSLDVSWDKFYIWEPLRIKIPVITMPDFPFKADSTIVADTVFTAKNDSLQFDDIELPGARKSYVGLKDTTIMVIIDTLDRATSNSTLFPFRYLDFPYQSDSIKVAVESLLDFVEKRDSTVINFTGIGIPKIPVWLNSRTNGIKRRYWLKNEFSDSVTVWIGNEDKNTFGLYLEQGINFKKPAKQGNYSEAKINVQQIDNSKLHKVQQIVVKKHYWKYRSESSLVFSQSAMSNWVKGGENSVSSALDITGYADFKRPELKLSSANFARLKLGFLKSGDNDVRKNLDLLETNSKLNHKAFGKFDFSAIMLFKTQVGVGKSYSKIKGTNRDTVNVVSKFFNPAVLTIGIGLDYKPNKETSINFSPLSYKGTFVPAAGKMAPGDTVPLGRIDQTRYGVPVGKRALNEPGASFMISKISRPFKNLTLTNRVQLFTNYINNPWNIDIDWEMIAVANLNWFTDVRLNTHLIFDDDTKTTVMEGGAPVYLEDGKTPKKTARAQFKEMFGISLVFRF